MAKQEKILDVVFIIAFKHVVNNGSFIFFARICWISGLASLISGLASLISNRPEAFLNVFELG